MTNSLSTPVSRSGPNPWWVGTVCGMATFVDGAALTGVTIALVLYQMSIGLTPDQVGVLTAALTLGVAVGSLLGGRLGDRLGRRKVFLGTMVLIVLGAGLPVLSTGFPLLLAGIGMLGLGVGADLPVALATISESANDTNRGKIIVFSNILGGCGIAAAVLVGIFFGGSGLLGGQIMFAMFAVVALVTLVLRLSIPESASWLQARAERRQGITTIRADKVDIRDLWHPPYRRPFVTLVLFYSLTTVAVSVAGTFGTYVAVNVAHLDIQQFSTVSLVALPLSILASLWFMRVADTALRMPYFVVGAVTVVVANLIPVAFGFTFLSLIGSTLLSVVGGAFCFETIMKVWTQESFPVMLRATAQGTVYAIARFCAAGLAVVTPALLLWNPSGLYLAVAVVAAIGLTIGWLGFRRNARNEFDHEQELDPEAVAVAGTTV